MYDLNKKTLEQKGKTEAIISFEVWFQVPHVGLSNSLDRAQELCKENDLDSRFCIIPVPVALSETFYEILLK